jgi:hypothetical protein
VFEENPVVDLVLITHSMLWRSSVPTGIAVGDLSPRAVPVDFFYWSCTPVQDISL